MFRSGKEFLKLARERAMRPGNGGPICFDVVLDKRRSFIELVNDSLTN